MVEWTFLPFFFFLCQKFNSAIWNPKSYIWKAFCSCFGPNTCHSSRVASKVFSAIFHSGGQRWGTGETNLGLKRLFRVLGMLFTPTITLLAWRRPAGERGRSDIYVSILPQWEPRYEKFSDTLWSQQMASSRTGSKSGPSHSSQVSLLHVFALYWALHVGDCKKATNKITQENPTQLLEFLGLSEHVYTSYARVPVCFII